MRIGIGQSPLPDSLNSKLSKANSVSEVKVVIRDAITFAYNDPEIALLLSKKIADLSLDKSFFEQAAKAYDIMGVVLQNQGKFDTAFYYYSQALKIKQDLNEPKLLAESLNNFGVLNRKQGRYDSALQYYHRALEISLSIQDSLLIGNYFNNIGLVHENKEEYAQAVDFHIKSLKIREALDDKKGIAGSLNNIGIVYQRMDDHRQAIDYLAKSLEVKRDLGNKRLLASAFINLGVSYHGVGDYDKALLNIEQSLTLYQELGDVQSIASAYDNLSFIAQEKGDLSQAISYQQQSLKERKNLGKIDDIVLSHSHMSRLYRESNDYERAKYHAWESYELARNSGSVENLQISTLQLSNIYEVLGELDKALEYHKIYTRQKDSLLSVDMLKNVAEIKEKYESEKKEAEIARQNLEVQRQNAVIKSHSTERVLLIGIVASILLVSILLFMNYRTKLRAREQLVEQNKVFERDRSRFFAGISHEFRTPLALITAPLSELRSKYGNDRDTLWILELIQRNSNRLLSLINQLLDLSKLEAGKLVLSVSKKDIISWSKLISASFESLATSREIQYKTQFPSSDFEIYFDEEKLEQVLINLLSNAFKYTVMNGEVRFLVSVSSQVVTFQVKNTGQKIPDTEKDKIFDRFYQSATDNKGEGTGIGLALVKEFSELHHGSVRVYDDEDWTVFEVCVPADDTAYTGDEKIESDVKAVTKLVDKQSEGTINTFQDTTLTEDKPLVLVVEDNDDLRNYISYQLSGEFVVEQAMNGLEGVQLAQSIPDLIITDLMMPEMDGIELLQVLRSEAKTRHIPIIMLTAKAEKESKIQGLNEGADHYLNKPFDSDELITRVRSLIIQRHRIKDHYYKEFLTAPSADDIVSVDDLFLKNAVKSLEKELDNHEFSVDQFARELAMSRAQLHRKLKAIIGCSTSEFIRHYRIKKANEFLKSGKGTVSEIAYSVGFNNLSYFTKSFKAVYKISPSEVLK
ncbi:MAG: tetratricopeptide repeat protein [Bacteroidota bacterium]